MKTPRMVNSVGHIDDDLIIAAAIYKKEKKKTGIKWLVVAACLCIAVMGIFSLLDSRKSPFVLTAYALDEEMRLLSLKMEEGQSIPISTFTAGNGMEGFVFSHKSQELEPFVSIISTDFAPYIMSDSVTSTTAEKIGKINRIDMEKTRQYIFFVPSEGESAPYSLTVSIFDKESSTAANLNIVIEKDKNGYSAKVDKINSYEIIGDIDELLKPYQEVIDRLNAEYDCKLSIHEDRKYSVYEAYKDLSLEEFEKHILEELNESIEEFEGNGEINFEIIIDEVMKNEKTDDYYKFNRTRVTEVTGTSQMSDPVKHVVIPKDSVDKLLNQIEELCLQIVDGNNTDKGWEYLFNVKYDDGSTTQISLSEGKVIIDGILYKTASYHSNDFLTYFD